MQFHLINMYLWHDCALQCPKITPKSYLYLQGCSANRKGVGTHQKNSHFKTDSKPAKRENVFAGMQC